MIRLNLNRVFKCFSRNNHSDLIDKSNCWNTTRFVLNDTVNFDWEDEEPMTEFIYATHECEITLGSMHEAFERAQPGDIISFARDEWPGEPNDLEHTIVCVAKGRFFHKNGHAPFRYITHNNYQKELSGYLYLDMRLHRRSKHASHG